MYCNMKTECIYIPSLLGFAVFRIAKGVVNDAQVSLSFGQRFGGAEQSKKLNTIVHSASCSSGSFSESVFAGSNRIGVTEWNDDNVIMNQIY